MRPWRSLDVEGACVQTVGVFGHMEVKRAVEELHRRALQVHEESVEVHPVNPLVLPEHTPQKHHLVPSGGAAMREVLRDDELIAVLRAVPACKCPPRRLHDQEHGRGFEAERGTGACSQSRAL